jgi:hypothetical protein
MVWSTHLGDYCARQWGIKEGVKTALSDLHIWLVTRCRIVEGHQPSALAFFLPMNLMWWQYIQSLIGCGDLGSVIST